LTDIRTTGDTTGEYTLALCADLIFSSKIRAAAAATGASAQLARTVSNVLERARATPPPQRILLDLDARGDMAALIRELKSDAATSHIPIIAFASHVREDAIAAARAAGADRVVARSAFVRLLPELLK
jgi:CheY-like chemotaxis protein